MSDLLMTPAAYEAALGKLRERWDEFDALGWTVADLVGCAVKRYGHHGLALYLRPGYDLARIWEWCVEILCSVAGDGDRATLVYWRRAPLAELLATVGEHVIPAEVRERWRCKL